MSIFKTNANGNSARIQSQLLNNLGQLGVAQGTSIDGLAKAAAARPIRELLDEFEIAGREFQEGRALLRAADKGLMEIESLTEELSALALESQDEDLTQEERTALNDRFGSIRTQIDLIAEDTEFNGVSLLDGSREGIVLADGIAEGKTFTIDLTGSKASDLNLSNISLLDVDDSEDVISSIGKALGNLSKMRDQLGAADFRLSELDQSLTSSKGSLLATSALVQDVGTLLESAQQVSSRIGQQGNRAVLLQANVIATLAQRLLG